MCGEKLAFDGFCRLRGGSPPRVRGKVLNRIQYKQWRRITPACAGKSQHVNIYSIKKKDHPRVCGEKDAISYFHFRTSGSPPRVRGKADPAL